MDQQITFAEIKKEEGMLNSISHADSVNYDWLTEAMKVLILFLETRYTPFMAEDIRAFASTRLPKPPSNRAWGSIIKKASVAKLIKFISYRKTTNPKAHRTPAALWVKV